MNKETDVVYVVNRFRISASEYNQNGYTRTFVFRDINRAKRCLQSLRAEDLYYDIYTDTDEKFHVAWDSDLEMIFITLKEKIIDEEV